MQSHIRLVHIWRHPRRPLSPGFISSNIEELDRLDASLLLFTSYLLDENGDTTYTATETYDIINETKHNLGVFN